MRRKSNAFETGKVIITITLSVLLLTSLFVLASANDMTATAEESDEVQLITSQSSDSGEVVAASGSNKFVVWVDDTPGNNDILFKRSADNGATWKATVNLSSNTGSSENPRLLVVGSNVYVTWMQYSTSGASDVYFRRSTDNGATWGAKINISTSGIVEGSDLAVSGNNVYIAFGSYQDLFFKRSSNNGASFGNKIRLSPSSDGGVEQGEVAITATGSHVIVGWQDEYLNTLVRHSANNGASWEPIDEIGSTEGIISLGLVTTGSYVYAIWGDSHGCGGEYDLVFSRSSDYGASWQDNVSITCSEAYLVNGWTVAISGNRIFVVYEDSIGNNGENDVFMKRSTDNGATWKSRVNLSNNPGDSQLNGLAVQPSNVYVIWTQLNLGQTLADIYLRRSTDNGATWKTSQNISNNPGWSEHGNVAVSGSNVYFTWDDTTYGDTEILFRRSTDNGVTLKPVIKISNNAGSSTLPRILAIGSYIFIVWTDSSPGNNEVLHRRSTDNGATWKAVQNLSNNSGDSSIPQIAG